MSFSYDIGTTLGRVRLAITDTHQDTAVFSDEEIQDVLDQCGAAADAVDCATLRLLRILKAAAALRGDVARVGAIDEVMDALPSSALETGMPCVTPIYPAPWPMDDAYVEPQQ